MSIASDIKSYGETAFEQTKVVAAEASKPLYALVGAGEIAVEQSKQFASKAQEQATDLREKAAKQATDLRGKVEPYFAQLQEKVEGLPEQLRQLDPAALKELVSKYFQETSAQAISLYADLTNRGEKVVEELRKQPAVAKVFAGVEDAVDTVEDKIGDLLGRGSEKVAEAADKVEDEAKAVKAEAAPKTAPRRTSTRKPAASKSDSSK